MDQRRLILWDLDGTVALFGPPAGLAFDRAVARVAGRDSTGHGVRMMGKTDPLIAREIMSAIGLADEDAERLLPGTLAALEEELAASFEELTRKAVVMPGVEALLRTLDAEPRVHQSVLTGNLAANARLKLAAVGLDTWLDLETGAYGSDRFDREELVPVALERAERIRGLRFEPGDVWIIGDTPRDLACARAGGARCLLVATGRIGYEELSAMPADAVLEDLGDTARVLEILLG